MTPKRIISALFLVLLVAGSIWILKYRGTATLREAEGTIFGTYYHIKYEAPQALDNEISRALHEVDASMSVFNKQSTLSAINAGTSMHTDALLYEVLTKARKVSEATDGAFDVTVMQIGRAHV